MDALELANRIADPIGILGMSYYFSPQAVAVGETIELDVVTFYAAGRGGVLGDIDAVEVDEIFYFFKSGMIATLIERGRASTDRGLAVERHMEAAAQFANDTFGAVPNDVLEGFATAAEHLVAALPSGRWPLVDGYLALDVPTELIPRAYYFTVVLRELRGGVHTDAVKAEGLSGLEACQLDRGGMYFGLHGYGDDERVAETDALKARRALVEEETSAAMAALLDALNEEDRRALLQGTELLYQALGAPVPAS